MDQEQRYQAIVIELMEAYKDLSEAQDEAARLRELIARHARQTAHNICWRNDLDLWKAAGVVPSDTVYPHDKVPPEHEFLEIGCRAFYRGHVLEETARSKP